MPLWLHTFFNIHALPPEGGVGYGKFNSGRVLNTNFATWNVYPNDDGKMVQNRWGGG